MLRPIETLQTKIVFMLVLLYSHVALSSENTIVLESLIQNQNYKEPWKSQSTDTIYNLALYIGDNKFLTTYRSIHFAKSITGQRIGEYHKFEMSIYTADRDLNIAILTPSKEAQELAAYKSWIQPFKAIELADEVPIGMRVNIMRLGQNLTVKSLEGQVLDVVNGVAGYGQYRAPLYRFDSSLINNTNQSEPIFSKNKLVALSSYVNSGSLYALPSTLIKDFIDRSRNGKYEGIPSVYFNAKATINPFERTQFGVPEQVSDGFMITSIDAISPFSGQLEENDLITKMNGMSINYKAEVNHPVWEKITVTYFLKRLRIGDSVEIEGYRKGEKFKLSVKLDKKYDSQKFLVPPYFDDLNANYAVAGGLVFHNLSEDFLENWGANWKESAPVDLVVQAAYRQEFIPNKGEEKIVVLSHVLPMEFNKGYHGVNNYILESVNGTSVQSVEELVRVLNSEKKSDSEYLVFKFKAEGLKIVLYKKELKELRAKVIDKFGIPESAQVL